MSKTIVGVAVLLVLFNACVSQKKFNATSLAYKNCQEKLADANNQIQTCSEDKQAAIARLDEANQHIELLKSDSVATHGKLEKEIALNTELQTSNDALLKQKNELLENASAQSNALTKRLQQKQTELDQKQTELDNKELNINALTNELKMRMYRVNELEHVLNSKDSIMNNLKKKIAEALEGFSTSDLTIERKNGKVYVSMADKLLFKSGSAEVDVKGKEALKKLAEVLARNKDIQVMVEGHTDNDKLAHDTYPKNNWDLSVLRATAIVKIITDNKVEANRVIAAGRGEYFPVADNAQKEGRAKNRRTEIILTPKLDELVKIIDAQ